MRLQGGPEVPLQAALRVMEEKGHKVISVSVLRPGIEEAIEVLVVSRHNSVEG